MNTLFRNFSHTFRRFFTASVLNLLGLSIAFAACFVILTQVDYDYNYNKAYPHTTVFTGRNECRRRLRLANLAGSSFL